MFQLASHHVAQVSISWSHQNNPPLTNWRISFGIGEGPAAITAAAASDHTADWLAGWLADRGMGDMKWEEDLSWNSCTIS